MGERRLSQTDRRAAFTMQVSGFVLRVLCKLLGMEMRQVAFSDGKRGKLLSAAVTARAAMAAAVRAVRAGAGVGAASELPSVCFGLLEISLELVVW